MREYVPDIELLPVKINRDHHPITSAADIEDGKLTDLVGGVEHRAHRREVCERRPAHHLVPCRHRSFGGWVNRPEFHQRLAGNDVHDRIIAICYSGTSREVKRGRGWVQTARVISARLNEHRNNADDAHPLTPCPSPEWRGEFRGAN